MPLIFLALIMIFIVPWLGLILLAFFLFLFLLVPLGFAARSLAWLVVGPREFVRVISDPLTRKNHALEHGTINVIEERGAGRLLTGESFKDGFAIRGIADPAYVLDAAREARRRISAGDRALTVNKRCGTTLVVINTISAVIFLLLLLVSGRISILAVILSIVAAYAIGPVASPWVQRHITTDPDFSSLEISGVYLRPVRSVVPVMEVYVHTRVKGRAPDTEVVYQ
ncbi:MAG TPA: DUF6391 domain-containing protein [Synergistales bacterium]|nr:DUF6391 domain-containing protein [Synergistales bacterium]